MNKVHKVEPMGLDDLMMYQHRAGSMEGGVPKSLGGAGMGHSIFEFPPVSGDLMGPEGGPLHPKGRQTTPFSLPPMYTFSVVQAPYHEGDSSGPGGMYMEGPPVTGSSGDLTNRNNNNSTVESHPVGPSLSVHSNGYMPRIVSNGPIPSSPPGHFMPPSCELVNHASHPCHTPILVTQLFFFFFFVTWSHKCVHQSSSPLLQHPLVCQYLPLHSREAEHRRTTFAAPLRCPP